MSYGTGGAAAAAAAAEARRRMQEEEELMTPYTEQELHDDWEFKIVRANTGAFGNPETLRKVIAEEQAAGWMLLEKLDNARLRFKRRRSAQANDAQLIASGLEPYRTHYGMSPVVFALLIVGITLLGSAFLLVCVLLPLLTR